MLQFAIDGKIKEIPLIGKQIYCGKHDDGAKLAGFRNPHITMGNVLVVENKYKEEFATYFNLTDNIVVSNAYDNDIMYRLQGQDYDSDTLLLCSDPILVKAAEACQIDNFRVPINGIKAENKDRKYTLKDEVDIDHKTAQNKIGEIVNLSQILNSYYWDYNSKNSDGQYDGLLKEYYNQISILSSLSQIEIDRAKKDYGTETGKLLWKLRDRKYNGKLLLERDKKSSIPDKLPDNHEQLLPLYMIIDSIEEKSFPFLLYIALRVLIPNFSNLSNRESQLAK
jgi:5-formaminoimidazole-4-carboxamide-1-beta-D-ribofuranosyl 5'-monophosphate synthetase